MNHRTLVGGTAYNVSGGKSMVSGTVYDITGGKTLVSGTGYNINFGGGDPTAMLYSDGNMVFQLGDSVESGKTLSASYTGFEDVTYSNYSNVPWYSQCNNVKNVSFEDNISTSSLTYWFRNYRKLVTVNYSGLDIDSVINMSNTYCYCYNLTGSPVCGDKVTNMSNTYSCCNKLKGSPVCGNNVINMSYAYFDCYNLTGSPVCGDNVTNMDSTYASCYNLTGSPVCGDNVTNMHQAYSGCRNLTGSPVCGDNVTDMDSTYANCYNLTGIPICGINVTSVNSAYRNCQNIANNAYFYSAVVNGCEACFAGKNNYRRLNIYVPAGSTTNKKVHNTMNYLSLVANNITYTNAGTYSYNTAYNIYIYPVENVAAARLANGD